MPNTPADIAAGSSQSFVFGITPVTTLNAAEVALTFACVNAPAATSVFGLNTLSLSAAATPTPDLVAIGATLSNDGVVAVPVGGVSAFATAAVNIGAGGDITASADDNGRDLPLALTICRTNPSTGACTVPAQAAGAAISAIGANEIATFAVFVRATGAVPFDPANNRLFLRLRSADGVTRGATSVAVRTP